MSNRNRYQECNLNDNYAAGQIAAIQSPRLLPNYSEEFGGFEIRTARYTIVLGGPNPCSYSLDYIRTAADSFTPTVPGDVAMPFVGELVTFAPSGKVLAVKAIQNFQRRKSGNCRFVDFDVILDNACQVDNPFYKPDGTLITDINELPQAAAQITRRSNSRQVNVESAYYAGIYSRKGEKIDETTKNFESTDTCCRPIKNMFNSVYFDDKYDDSFLPVNAAGVPFDPPLQKDVTEASYVLRKPFFAIDGCKLDRADQKLVNCAGFWLINYEQGRITFCTYVRPGTARIESINHTPAFFCDGTPIVMVDVEIRVRNNIIYARELEGTDEIKVRRDFGWDELVPNKGFGALICKDDPDQFGGLAAPNDKTVGGAGVQEIFDASGNPLRDPSWLDHKGHPISIKPSQGNYEDECVFGLDQDQLIYIRYAPYQKVSFTDSAILPGFLDYGVFDSAPDVPEGYPADYCQCDDAALDEIYVCTTTTSS